MSVRLLTKVEYDQLTPAEQGYACYMQAAQPGSEIPDVNPYPVGSEAHTRFEKGQFLAMVFAQDGDD